jgi:hypothetical protein
VSENQGTDKFKIKRFLLGLLLLDKGLNWQTGLYYLLQDYLFKSGDLNLENVGITKNPFYLICLLKQHGKTNNLFY